MTLPELRRTLFMFFCGILRSIMSHEHPNLRTDVTCEPRHEPPNPARWRGLRRLFRKGTMERDVLEEMLAADIDATPADIRARLAHRYPVKHARLDMRTAYAARRRVKERLAAHLAEKKERLPVLRDAVTASYVAESPFAARPIDHLEEAIVSMELDRSALRAGASAWKRLRSRIPGWPAG